MIVTGFLASCICESARAIIKQLKERQNIYLRMSNNSDKGNT
jgi:hypothetical protein